MKIEFRTSFARDLQTVRDKNLLQRARQLIEVVEKANTLTDVPNLKKLSGSKNYFRLKVGDYRMGVAFEKDTVIFVRFLNRKDIYRYFP